MSLIVTASFLAYVAIPFFGNKALIVRSGSMQPAINVGDLVVVHTKAQITAPTPGTLPKYKVGDIVAFSGQKDPKTIITHRIAGVKTEDGKILYETKGDANNAPDSNLVAENKILGKNSFKIPGLGKVFALAKTRTGFLALVIVPALLVILFEAYSIVREIVKMKRKDKDYIAHHQNLWPQNTNKILFKVLMPFVIGVMFFQGSFSSYADTETSNGNVLQAAQFFSPTVSPSPGPNSSPSPNPSPVPLANHIVISEVQIIGDTAREDFVELYNPTNSAVDLNGWQLIKTNSEGTQASLVLIGSGESIPAQGFFLWSNNSNGFNTEIGADVSNTSTLAEDNSIALQDATDNTVDELGWGGPAPNQSIEGSPIANPGANESYERKAYVTSTSASMGIGGSDEFKGNGKDEDNNVVDFILKNVSQLQNSASPTETP